jgi:hypothetical protein
MGVAEHRRNQGLGFLIRKLLRHGDCRMAYETGERDR